MAEELTNFDEQGIASSVAEEYKSELSADFDASSVSDKFRAYVVTPYEIFFDKACNMLILPSADGELGVMKGHAPLVIALYPGELRVLNEGVWSYAFVSNGYAQIERDYVTIVCNSAEWADDIDTARAQEALERAQERYDNESLTAPERKRAAHAIRRSKNRLSIAARAAERRQKPSI